jgi:3'-phosphoadenosine 5'-phosphosulfate sulfotransferase (PAPS reductase)/FAD synthetase
MKLKVGKKNDCIPEGEYLALVTGIRKTQTFKRPALEFNFEIADGEHKGNEVKGFCNADYECFTSRTKFYEWYERATGDSPANLEEMDTEDFQEKVLRVKVASKPSKKTGIMFSNVIDILGVKCDI